MWVAEEGGESPGDELAGQGTRREQREMHLSETFDFMGTGTNPSHSCNGRLTLFFANHPIHPIKRLM